VEELFTGFAGFLQDLHVDLGKSCQSCKTAASEDTSVTGF
jgi:hypothetical protein